MAVVYRLVLLCLCTGVLPGGDELGASTEIGRNTRVTAKVVGFKRLEVTEWG